MQDFHTVVVAIFAFIVLIGVMVVVHEFGHFAVAKLCGVRVEAFSVGFGPRLFGIKYGETDYKVCLLPLGGYVKMTGESPEQNLQTPGKPVMQQMVEGGAGGATTSGDVTEDPGSFTAHPRWQRMLIGVAGPVANFILAFGLMFFYYYWINEVPKYVVNSTTVEWVVPGSAAAEAGFQPGDVITRFDGATDPDWMQVGNRAQMNLNQTVQATVDRAGKPVQLSLHVPPLSKGQDELDFSDAGILPQFMPGAIGVHDVQPGTPADRAGLQAGDQIESVDGHQFHTVSTLLAYMQAYPGKDLTLVVERNAHDVTLHAQPTQWDSTWKLGFQAVGSPMRNDPLPMHKAIAEASDFCTGNSTLIVEVLGRLFTRKVAVSQLSGPVGIARMAGQAAEMEGWLPKLGLAAAISINLGILNLLPFPILDGGLILLLLIESVLRHDISINVKERIYQAAFVVLVVFFAFVIFNDVTKLPPFTHVRP
ncbi:MAG TPA: RIP metalloprotease RseP [Terracidiphilus sp.]|jgi:regulator of sigma E protease|nr:RIP metalloprotease RseP [Terracidiphilus sp.]